MNGLRLHPIKNYCQFLLNEKRKEKPSSLHGVGVKETTAPLEGEKTVIRSYILLPFGKNTIIGLLVTAQFFSITTDSSHFKINITFSIYSRTAADKLQSNFNFLMGVGGSSFSNLIKSI